MSRAWYRINIGDTDTTLWYAKPEAWDTMLKLAGFSADVFRTFNKPVVADTIDSISTLVRRQVRTKEDVNIFLRRQIQAITKQLQSIDKVNDAILYARLDAQLELVMQLMNEDKVSNG